LNGELVALDYSVDAIIDQADVQQFMDDDLAFIRGERR
jgi:hypothetical protein